MQGKKGWVEGDEVDCEVEVEELVIWLVDGLLVKVCIMVLVGVLFYYKKKKGKGKGLLWFKKKVVKWYNCWCGFSLVKVW